MLIPTDPHSYQKYSPCLSDRFDNDVLSCFLQAIFAYLEFSIIDSRFHETQKIEGNLEFQDTGCIVLPIVRFPRIPDFEGNIQSGLARLAP